MRPTISAALAGVGYTPWIPLDYEQTPFDVSLGLLLSSGGAGTFTAQYTLDDLASQTLMTVTPNATGPRQVIVNQTGTTVTVTDSQLAGIDHGLVAGDSVILNGAPGLTGLAAYGASITYINSTSYSFTSSVSQTLTNVPAQALPIRVYPVAALTAVTARTAAQLNGIPATGVRLQCTAYTGGNAWLQVLQGLSK